MRTDTKMMIETLRRAFKRLHYPVEVMLVCVRWYVAYPLSLRQLVEMMTERGVVVDHSRSGSTALDAGVIAESLSPTSPEASRTRLSRRG